MSEIGELQLGELGSEITLPHAGRQFSETDLPITREARTSAGNLVEDVIAYKKLFAIDYEILVNEDLENIVDLYDLHEHLNFIIKDRDENTRNYTVKFRPFSRRRWTVEGNNWWWQDATLQLEEI